MMRTIYENYRGFKVSKQEDRYNANAISNEIKFSQWKLSDVLDSIDHFIELNCSSEIQSVLPQN
ncbi:hypothetical protein [Paenibacillus aestuarii]|uniref:Uncharacterized protein n=1 Tax=Paenibacillus aestuarii TaxID=516965 RepID=A0ABW0K9T9_9BACL|nr:hypothetical protein [Paenibacillus aestuarii]